MRTLRYLGIFAKTGLKEKEADNFLEKIKLMPEVLGIQEIVYLTQYGFSFKNTKQYSKYEILDMLKGLGRNLYVSKKTRTVRDEDKKRDKVKELILRLGKPKVVFNMDVNSVVGIVAKFTKFRLYNRLIGFEDKCNIMEEDGLRIESKFDGCEEYLVITKI